jgi:hypothetical protein
MRQRFMGVVSKWSSSLYSGIELEVKLTTHLHLVLRWGMSGAVPILTPYAFMSHTGTTLSRTVCYWKLIDMVTTWEIGKRHKPPSIQEKLSIQNKVDATWNVMSQKNCCRTWHFYVNSNYSYIKLRHNIYTVCKWTAETKKKMKPAQYELLGLVLP